MAVENVSIVDTLDDGRESPDTGTFLTNATTAGHDANGERIGFLRFQAVDVPQGATITSATLTVEVTAIAGSPDTECHGVDVDDLAQFADPGNLPSNAALTTASTNFAPTGEGSEQIDVTAQMQAIVNRAAWVAGNDLGFLFRDNVATGSNIFQIEDFEDAGTGEASLSIEYSEVPPDAEPPTGTATGVGHAPTQTLSGHPPAGEATGQGHAPNPFLAGATPPTGTATGQGFAPRIRLPVQKPELLVQVQFEQTSLFVGTLHNISEDVRSGRISRGISLFDGVYGSAEAGKAELVLNNRSGNYDPTNEDSDHWDAVAGKTQVQPMRLFMIRLTYNGVLFGVFFGFVDSWQMNYPGFGKDATATLTGTDAIKLFSAWDRPAEADEGANDKVDERIVRVADDVGWPLGQRDLFDDPLGGLQATDLAGDQWKLVTEAAETNLGLVFFSGEGALTYNSVFNFPGSPVATFGDGDGELPFESVELAHDDTQLANRVTITATGGTPQTQEDTASQDEFGLRTFDRELPLLSDTAAATHAERVLTLLSQPLPRIERITINPFARYGLFEQVLARDIGARIAVKFSVLGRTARVERECFILGIEHTFDAVAPWWRTTWTLADAERFDDLGS